MPDSREHTDLRTAERGDGQRAPRRFDGIICFGGEDWWYHNRGHFDMQIMRRLSTELSVLYVNSIGMRMPDPREGRMFITRMGRKLRSIRRGLVRVDDGFSVLSPPVLPTRAGMALTERIMTRAVRAAARRQGIRRPLVWIACPTAAHALPRLRPAAIVYQRTDRYECYTAVNAARIAAFDRQLKAEADMTVFCSTMLFEQEAANCRSACLIDHGVDFEHFASAAESAATEPDDVALLPRPRIGFVGGIDAHTFDEALFLDVARRLPEAHFVLVGACSLPAGWCDRPNVTILGRRAYEQVPRYMAACDALIMPWKRCRWIEACNPVKLKEYLAVGRPVVSTEYHELWRYDGLVRTADDAGGFADAIADALRDPGDAQHRRDRVRDESWDVRAKTVLEELAARNIARPRPVLARRLDPSPPPAQPQRVPFELRIADDSRPAATERTAPPPLDLAACILLAGGLRPSPLAEATGRSVLDLWLTAEETVLDIWAQRIARCTAGMDSVLLRVVHDAMQPAPWPGPGSHQHVLIEQEPKIFRGPAGVLSDLCAGYGPHRHVLVAEAARFVTSPLSPLLLHHAATSADITVVANVDDSPAGVYLIRCGALDLVPSVGFMDLKEQWLRRALQSHLDVRVHRLPAPGSLPLRTRQQFLDAARIANGHGAERNGPGGIPNGPPADETPSPLRVVCPGALIGPAAVITDSIVMPGAVVASDSVVVRSLVCPDAYVQAGADIADTVVHSGACLSDVREERL